MNVFIEGYYGVKNLGDDYILLSILTSLSKISNQIDHVVVSSIYDDYQHVFSLFPQLDCSAIYTRDERMQHLKSDDIYVLGGGGLFPDDKLTRFMVEKI